VSKEPVKVMTSATIRLSLTFIIVLLSWFRGE
jgi:hypothetical protein